MEPTFIFELIGTIAFAISGALIAIEKKMDIFGVAMLGLTTAIGGGIIRDIILDVIPPKAFQNPTFAIISIVVSLIVFVVEKYQLKKAKFKNVNEAILFIMDSAGLAIFTVIGVRAGMVFNHPFMSIFMGMLTGVGGGVLRDIFAGERPYIFVKHFYACASIIGAIVTVIFWPVNEIVAMTFGAITVFALRTLAGKYRWNLPKAK